MTIYISFVVQQMYVSLTYPFNIVQYTLSHIVEHHKLDSLATPPQHCMINYDVMLDQQCSSIWLQPMILLCDN